jgi:hypothetical protein
MPSACLSDDVITEDFLLVGNAYGGIPHPDIFAHNSACSFTCKVSIIVVQF